MKKTLAIALSLILIFSIVLIASIRGDVFAANAFAVKVYPQNSRYISISSSIVASDAFHPKNYFLEEEYEVSGLPEGASVSVYGPEPLGCFVGMVEEVNFVANVKNGSVIRLYNTRYFFKDPINFGGKEFDIQFTSHNHDSHQ